MNKIIIVNKEKGLTSRDVVNKLCKIFNTKKIGHTGTLDPLASGVLVCLIGKYTKLVDLITSYDKEYIATIKLGIKTDTLDITGNILETKKVPLLELKTIKEVLNSFVGVFNSEVPLYSAIRINGKRLYEYARHNEEVKLPNRETYIKKIELLEYHDDLIKFRAVVSKGTYIRSLIARICEKLNICGCMSDLERIRQGNFQIKDANSLESIANNNYQELSLTDVLNVLILPAKDNYSKIKNGNIISLKIAGYVLFMDGEKELALYYFENNLGKLKILFN